MKREIHPRFSYEKNPEEVCDLFNTAITNTSSKEEVAYANGIPVLIPAKCNFIMANFDRNFWKQMKKLDTKFDLVLVDPPWENKSVKYSSSYNTIPHKDIMKTPLQNFMKEDECIVFIWVTNKPKLISFVKEELLSAWELTYYTTWYWVKITNDGQLTYSATSSHKKPYERLIVAYRNQINEKLIPRDLFMWSTPGQHSTKPVLNRLLKWYCKKGGQCLELFARRLSRDWSAWGNEVLKFQQLNDFLLKI